MSAVDPGAVAPQPLRLLIHVVIRRIVRQDEIMRPQAGQRGDLPVNPFRLRVIGHAKGNRVMVGRGLKITMPLCAKDAVLDAIGIQRPDEVALVGNEQRQSAFRQLAPLDIERRSLFATGQLLQLNQPVQRCNIGDRQPRQIRLVVRAVRPLPPCIAGREQIACGAGQEQVVGRVATRLDEIGAPLEHRQVMRDCLRIPADQQQFRLQDHPRRGELHAPIMNPGPPVALFIDNPPWPRRVTQAAVRRHPIKRRLCADALAIADLVEPQVLRVLQERDERLPQERENGVGRAVGILDPPRVPGRPFDQPVPLRFVKHGQVLQFRVRLKHPPRRLQQPQILHVPTPAIVLAFETRVIRTSGERQTA